MYWKTKSEKLNGIEMGYLAEPNDAK